MDREDKLTTLVELSKEFGVSPHTAKRAAQVGTLVAEKPGRDWMSTRANFKAWLAARKSRMGRPKKK